MSGALHLQEHRHFGGHRPGGVAKQSTHRFVDSVELHVLFEAISRNVGGDLSDHLLDRAPNRTVVGVTD
ncbi:Uncharacterised protein [Mycobacteroides abscessus subsp. abscessus]|nr:Uncharacterised protein [Mycobacteroides abscessus subsp. abscessus]